VLTLVAAVFVLTVVAVVVCGDGYGNDARRSTHNAPEHGVGRPRTPPESGPAPASALNVS